MVPSEDKDEKAWASPRDYKLDLSLLIKRLKEQENRIEKVRYAKSPDIQFTEDLPTDWEELDIEKLDEKEE